MASTATFDPDAFLKSDAPTDAFDPDAFIAADDGFDPDAFLKESPKPLTAGRVAEVAGDLAAEAGGATVGQMIGAAGGPLAPATIPLGGFIGGAVGNTVAQMRRMGRGEQDRFRFGELLGVAGTAAIPGATLAKGATVLGRVARSGAIMGAAGAAGNVAQQKFDRPEESGINVEEVATVAGLSAAGGGLVQGGVEAAKAGFGALRRLFPKANLAGMEGRSQQEIVAHISQAEGIPPTDVEARIARARNVTPRTDAEWSAAAAAENHPLALPGTEPQPALAGPAEQPRLTTQRAPLALGPGEAPITPVPAAAPDAVAFLPDAPPTAPDIAPPAVAPAVAELPQADLFPNQPPSLPPTALDNFNLGALLPAAEKLELPIQPARLPEPAPMAAPAPAQGANPSPSAGDTITMPVRGGATHDAAPKPVGKAKQAIVMPSMEAAQKWVANRSGLRDVAITQAPGGNIIVSYTPKGASLKWGPRPDGITDIIDHIESLGGVPAMPKGAKGGEWNGYPDTFSGKARWLVNGQKRGVGIDQFIQQLEGTEFQHLAKDPDGFFAAVRTAVTDRERLKITNALESNTQKFLDAALENRGRGGADSKAGKPLNTDTLNVGDKLGFKGQKFEVTDVSPDDGSVTVKDGPRFGTQILPPGTEVFPDTRSVKRTKATVDPMDWPDPTSGAINPALVRGLGFAAARGVAGAALGALYSDNPEERAGHMLAGGLLGIAASPGLAKQIGRVAFRSTKLGRSQFPEATLPHELREALILAPGNIAATGTRGNQAQRALEKALRAEADPQAAADEVWAYMTGASGTIRPTLLPHAIESRLALDELSDNLIISGVATGKLADTINRNLGVYLRRAYRLFQRDDWRPGPAVFDRWVQKYEAATPLRAGQTAAERRQEGIDTANALLDRQNAQDFIETGSMTRQNRDAFIGRKELDAETLELLGEIRDPVELMGQTVPRMARLIETKKLQDNIAVIGQRLGVFAEHSDNATGFTVQVAKDEAGPSSGTLAGLWTTPKMRDALEAMSANAYGQNAIWRTLAGATSIAKTSKTVFNPESWVPNAAGALTDALKNGNVRLLGSPSTWKDAVAVAAQELGYNPTGAAGRAASVALFKKMQRLGMVGQGSDADFARGMEVAWGEAAKRGIRNGLATMGRGYAASENVARFINWQSEVAAYRAAFPSMPQDELEQYAARMVRATTTNYAMIPQAVRRLSVGGVLGTFVNYPYEQFRHGYNIPRIATRDIADGMATGNPELIKVGMRRLAAFMVVVAGTGAYSAWTKREAGITDEQDAALRRRMPPWDRNQILNYLERDGNRVAYMSQSYLNPQAILLAGAEAARRGETLEEGAANFLQATLDTFGGGSILVKPGVETILNRMERGRQIASPEASVMRQAMDRGGYFLDRGYTPGFMNTLSRMAKGWKGEVGPDGQVYTLGDAMQRLVGRRVNRLDIPFRLQREAKDLSARLADVASQYAGRRYQAQGDTEKRDAGWELTETWRQKVWGDVKQYIADAKVLGYGEDKAIRWLRDGGVAAEVVLSAIDGNYVPAAKEATKTMRDRLEEMQAKPREEQLTYFVATMAENPKFLQTVKTAAIEAARGVTERDRLMIALGPEKRADYLRHRLSGMDTPERTAFMHDMARKHVLTIDTLREMAKQ